MLKSRLCWIIAATFLIALCSVSYAVAFTCARCGRVIDNGQYIQADGKYYHPEHFVCVRCGKPIGAGKYFTRNGEIYDQKCYDQAFALKCAWCGKTISGEYITHDGLNYHQSCFAENVAPKCAWCSQPILDSSVTYEGKVYHNKCYNDHIGLRCGICGGIVEGQCITTFRGRAWHPWHKGKYPECDFCSALIDTSRSDTYVRYPDNRYLCSECARTAVTDIDSIKAMAQSVARIMSSNSMLISTENLEFKLVDANQMAAEGGHTGRDRRGFTDYRSYNRLFGLYTEQKLTVYLLNGMTTIECIEVLAHEMMHVWLMNQRRLHTAPQLCEGSCNYASMLVLKRYPGADADYIMSRMLRDTTEIYGEGLRHVRAFVEQKGTAAWLDYITTHDKNPWISNVAEN